jgi:hypothetical protein
MRVYEDYASPAEKRNAQKGAKRGQPSGKARGYIFVFDENGVNGSGCYDAVASVFDVEPGCDDPKGNLASTGVSIDYLRTRCRKVGGCHLPPKWKERWNYYRTPEPQT